MDAHIDHETCAVTSTVLGPHQAIVAAVRERAEGQVQAPAVKTLGLRLGKRIKLRRGAEIEVGANVFNLLNAGNYFQYNYSGANETFNPNFLQMRNQQAARGFQTTAVFRF